MTTTTHTETARLIRRALDHDPGERPETELELARYLAPMGDEWARAALGQHGALERFGHLSTRRGRAEAIARCEASVLAQAARVLDEGGTPHEGFAAALERASHALRPRSPEGKRALVGLLARAERHPRGARLALDAHLVAKPHWERAALGALASRLVLSDWIEAHDLGAEPAAARARERALRRRALAEALREHSGALDEATVVAHTLDEARWGLLSGLGELERLELAGCHITPPAEGQPKLSVSRLAIRRRALMPSEVDALAEGVDLGRLRALELIGVHLTEESTRLHGLCGRATSLKWERVEDHSERAPEALEAWLQGGAQGAGGQRAPRVELDLDRLGGAMGRGSKERVVSALEGELEQGALVRLKGFLGEPGASDGPLIDRLGAAAREGQAPTVAARHLAKPKAERAPRAPRMQSERAMSGTSGFGFEM